MFVQLISTKIYLNIDTTDRNFNMFLVDPPVRAEVLVRVCSSLLGTSVSVPPPPPPIG